MFSEIYVIGKGVVAKSAQKTASEFFAKKAILCEDFASGAKADEFFARLKNALIISANNFYLFKASCICQNTIINYHNALLPKHRGVNAHIWAIWENDELSGISWHLVDSGIDTGKILIQKAIKLDENTTASTLLLAQHKLAITSLNQALQKLVSKEFIEQKVTKSQIHSKKDLPNNAFLELSWEEEKISRFLRAFDIGAFRGGVSLPKLVLFDKEFEVLFYEFSQNGLKLTLTNNFYIQIRKDK